MQPIVIEMVQNDTGPPRTFTCTRTDGSIVDLTLATSVKFYIYHPTSTNQTNPGTEACSIVVAASGTCLYQWGVNDLPDAGVYNAKLVVQYPTDKETALVTIEVDADPGDED